MKETEQKELLQAFQKEFEESGYETILKQEEAVSVLRILVDKLGEAELGAVIFEVSFAQDDGVAQLDEMEVVQYFATFDTEVCMEKVSPILNALNQLNLTSALGSFQVFDEERQLYFKYNGLVTGENAEQMRKMMLPVINWILAMLEDCYDAMAALVKGDF